MPDLSQHPESQQTSGFRGKSGITKEIKDFFEDMDITFFVWQIVYQAEQNRNSQRTRQTTNGQLTQQTAGFG